jgi:hypothetical protein
LHVPLGFILPLFLYLPLQRHRLHASFAPAFEQLILIQQEAAHAGGAHGTADVALLGTVVLAAALLTLAPRGRLGYRRHTD